MGWRCGEAFQGNLDRLTIALAKGASMGLVTYLVIKLVGVAHDNEWAYLATGWGQWFMLEIAIGVVLPLILFANAIHHNRVGLVRFAAFMTIFGIVLNRLNTSLIAFNWNLYQEIPHWKEVMVSITIFAIYIVTYRFILYRLPILYRLKDLKEAATETELAEEPHGSREGVPAPSGAYRVADVE